MPRFTRDAGTAARSCLAEPPPPETPPKVHPSPSVFRIFLIEGS